MTKLQRCLIAAGLLAGAAAPFLAHAENEPPGSAREQDSEPPADRQKCLKTCQAQVGACMDNAKDKAQKQACAEQALACLKGCGMGS